MTMPQHATRGFMALLTVIVLGAASLLMAVASARIGLDELEAGYVENGGQEVLAAADGCLEEALRRLVIDENYGLPTAPINLIIGSSSCIIEVADQGGGGRVVTVTAVRGDFTKKIEATLAVVGGVVTLNSWQEKSD